MVTVKERPILFSAPMVRAILEGRKTQTRRAIKWPWSDQPNADELDNLGDSESLWVRHTKVTCPYGQPGDRLWVRETFCQSSFFEPCEVRFRADGVDPYKHDMGGLRNWKPSIFMPRWASRLTLEVTDVRVERLQEISEDDAKAEGAEDAWATGRRSYAIGFRNLWDSINAKRAPWASNPWVWVIEFKQCS